MRPKSTLAGLADVVDSPRLPVPLDAVDVALLEELATDARLSQRQLATRLGVSAPTIGERMARLERSGVIRGYGVQVDWELLGFGVPVYLSISASDGETVGDVMRQLWEVPEIEEVTVVTGSLDMIAKARVRDHTHLRRLLLYTIWQIPGLRATETFIGMAVMPHKSFLKDLLNELRNGGAGADTEVDSRNPQDDR